MKVLNGKGFASVPFFNTHLVLLFYFLAPISAFFGGGFLIFVFMHLFAGALIPYIGFKFCKRITGSLAAGLLFYLAILLNPYFITTVTEIHFEIFGMLFLFLFVFFALSNRFDVSMVFFILALCAKEDVYLYAASIALVIARQIGIRRSLVCLAISSAYFFLVVRGLWPHYFPNTDERMMHSVRGGSEIDFLLSLFSSDAIFKAFSPDMRSFLLSWSGFLLAAVPTESIPLFGLMVVYANAIYRKMSTLQYYYSWPLQITVIILNLLVIIKVVRWIEGGRQILARFKITFSPAILVCLILVIFSVATLIFPPRALSPIFAGNRFLNRYSADDLVIRKTVIELVNSNGSALVDDTLYGILANRQTLCLSSFDSCGANAFLTRHVVFDYLAFTPNRVSRRSSEVCRQKLLAELRSDERYHLLKNDGNLIIYKLNDGLIATPMNDRPDALKN